MKVSAIMTTPVVTVELDDTLAEVKRIFDHTGFHHLMVVENKKLLGVISDRDLLKSLSPNIDTIAATPKDLATLNKRVHQIMSRHPVTVNEDDPIGHSVELFNANEISCLPVLDDKGEAVGVVTWRDIMRELGKRIMHNNPKS